MVSAGTTSVPDGIDQLTPHWLTSELGCDVTDVRVEQIAMDSGFSSLLDAQVVPAVQTAFRMVLTAIALVAGLLFADIISPEREV